MPTEVCRLNQSIDTSLITISGERKRQRQRLGDIERECYPDRDQKNGLGSDQKGSSST